MKPDPGEWSANLRQAAIIEDFICNAPPDRATFSHVPGAVTINIARDITGV